MNGSSHRLLPRLLREESGQMLPIFSFMLVALLAMTGLVIDVGRALYTQRQLQASTDAAAMAGAQSLPNANALAVAMNFSSVSGSLNASAAMPNVTMVAGYPKIHCLTTLQTQGMACMSPGMGNALTVRQQITIPLYFLRVIGKTSLTLAATSTAAMRGSTASPYNVVIVVDATGSMNTVDSDSYCGNTRLNCALQGVQLLLQSLSPCAATLTSCGTVTNGNVSNPVDHVSLYTFPGLASSSDAANDYNCTGQNPHIAPYSYPSLPVYQVVGFSTDYRSSNTSSILSGGSNIVAAAGGKSGCNGMRAIGGVGTYYAGVIYAAETALLAQSTGDPHTQNVLILLSDGDASAPQWALPGASTTSGTYPSTLNQCHQAITAAAQATAAGIRVYSVAYGATASGCVTDNPGITPCQTMEQIASAPQYFFSDYTAQGGSSSCISASQPTSSLSQIFSQIAGDLTVGRLIPDNTP